MIKAKKCKHNKSMNKICYACTWGKVDPRLDIDIYNNLYSNKIDNSSFEMACLLSKNINLWATTYSMPEENYFREIENSKRLIFSVNTLRQAYYVIRDFNDILESSNRKMSFSCYREIATSHITDEQKAEIRKIAETDKMTQRAVRNYIKKNYKNQTVISYTTTFDVSSMENSLMEIENFMKDHNVKKGDEITIKIKQIKKEVIT